MSTTFKHDFTTMFVIHDALRRELELLAKVTAKTTDDPRQVLANAAGWEMFKKFLHVHHGAEDEALWPQVREALAERPDDLALVDEMEAEHATIDPLLDSIDAAVADAKAGEIGALVDALVTNLTGHFKHEEEAALPLVDSVATMPMLIGFGQAHTARVGDDTPRFLPWMLDGASEAAAATVLRPLPDPVKGLYNNIWVPAYTNLERWPSA
ncbi:hemerythrin domain-containing protein [Kitasatospora sp. LaBMicrA B282]|uniref:hemerythrin domain-containing protein n=1 Tax=Kitasatospora sp. LaBMicrA B282 TaxID=3420949 RepID=UPI003D0B0E38